MERSKHQMLIYIEDLVNLHGFPIEIKINTKRKMKSKISNKILNYENEIILIFTDTSIKVNEVFYYSHVPTIVDTIKRFIDILKEENENKIKFL